MAKTPPAEPELVPDIPVPFCDEYRFSVKGGVITLWFAHAGRWRAACALPGWLGRDLHTKIAHTFSVLDNPLKAPEGDTSSAAIKAAADKIVPITKG